MYNEQLHKNLQRSLSPSSFSISHSMDECIQVQEEEPHEMLDHKVCFDLYVFEKAARKQNEYQALSIFREI